MEQACKDGQKRVIKVALFGEKEVDTSAGSAAKLQELADMQDVKFILVASDGFLAFQETLELQHGNRMTV